MKRFFALVLCLSTAHLGNAAAGGPKDQPVLLDVQPAAAPVPALKYQLLPEVAEMNPGNAVPAYLKCWAEQNNFFFNKEVVEERERLRTCPLTDIKPGSLKGYGGSALRQADFAARLEFADWNLLPQLREQGYMLLIPEVQQIRGLATALVVRGRGQLVDKDFDGAVGTLKTIFAMSRHLGEHPTVIAGLVGLAIAQQGCNLLEELIQQQGAPNVYWALTGLPPHLVDVRKAASADRSMWSYGMFDKTRVWTADYMRAMTQQLGLAEGVFGIRLLASILELPAEDKEAAEKWMQARTTDAEWLTAARKGLTDAGYPADAVAKYPLQQVIVHHVLRKALLYNDERLKWVTVPYWQAEAGLAELQTAPPEIEDKLAWRLGFAVPKVMAAHARLEQRLAMLRIAEAVRLDAVKNGGKLVTSLSDLSVPVPIDPVSGKAFDYKVDGLTATLAGKPTPAGKGPLQYKYEIRLRK